MYTQFFMLFAMMFTGFFLRKTKFLDEQVTSGLSKFVLYFCFTCMAVFNIGTLTIDRDIMGSLGSTLLIVILLFVIYALVVKYYVKLRKYPKEVSGLAEIAMTSPNNGFMGFPISLMFFGQVGLLYMAVHNAVYNVYVFSYGLVKLKENTKRDEEHGSMRVKIFSLAKVCFNPIIIGVLTGLILSLLEVPLDNVVGLYLETMGSLATPLSMVLIGSTLAESNFLETFRNNIVIEAGIMKNLILPAITFLLIYWLPIEPIAKSIIVLGMALPSGATVVILATREKNNPELSSKILFFSTLFAMGTLPLFLWIIEKTIG